MEEKTRVHDISLRVTADEPLTRTELLLQMSNLLARSGFVHKISLGGAAVSQRTTLGNLRAGDESLSPLVTRLLQKYKHLPDTVMVWGADRQGRFVCGLVRNKKTKALVHYIEPVPKQFLDPDDVPF